MPRHFLRPHRALALAVLALGAWSCKARPGPPPLPPGVDVAYDRHLAELDPRYRFLFAAEGRIFEARMQGDEETVLLDAGKEGRSPDVTFGDMRLSPDGRWLLVPYVLVGDADQSSRRLLLFDVHSREVRKVAIPQDEEYGFDVFGYANKLCHWIAPDRFVISLSHYPPGGGELMRFFEYDLADLSTPRAIDFGNVYPVIRQARGSAKLLWGRSDEPTNDWTIHAYDEAGSRRATREEKEEFLELWVGRPPSPNGPRDVVLDSYVNAEPLFDFEDRRSHWDIELDGRLARRTWSGASHPVWDEDLDLYTWHEGDSDAGTTYVMDAEGRYRSWHRGEWIVKVPRTG